MRKSRWILPYIKANIGLLSLVIFLGILTFAAGGALMFTSGHLISKSSLMPESIMAVYVSTVGVRAFGIMRSVSRYVERLASHSLVLKMLAKMRVQLYRYLEPQALLLKSRYRTGDILGLLADDIEHLQNFYLTTMFPAIVSIAIYATIVIGLGVFSLPIALLFLLLIGIIIFVLPWISLAYTKAKNAYQKQGRNQLYRQFTDAVFGISDWMFSGRTKNFVQTYEQAEKGLLENETKQFRFVNWRDFFSQLIAGIMVIVMVYWSTGEARSGAFSGTMIAAFVLAIMSLAEVFIPVPSAVSDSTLYQDSLERLDKIEDTSLPSFEEELHAETTVAEDHIELSIEHANFRYEATSRPIIVDMDLHLKPQDKIAIIGKSGTGKSTLLKLIQGALEPQTGAVKLNGASVASIRPQIPKLVSMLNQKAHLFNTSVLNNIRLGNQSATDEEVYEVAKQVRLHEMIMNMPECYHTSMAEMGARFSGGERQRIALARILLQDTPLVILDEPTVGLDAITEKELLRTMFETLADKTVIWVTHHLVGTEKMDKIYFLEDGEFIMAGSHEELLASSERYKNLYRLDRPFIQL